MAEKDKYKGLLVGSLLLEVGGVSREDYTEPVKDACPGFTEKEIGKMAGLEKRLFTVAVRYGEKYNKGLSQAAEKGQLPSREVQLHALKYQLLWSILVLEVTIRLGIELGVPINFRPGFAVVTVDGDESCDCILCELGRELEQEGAQATGSFLWGQPGEA